MKFNLTKEEMVAKAKGYTAEQLLGAYEWLGKNFDPLEDTHCDFYGIVHTEVLRRLERGKD